MTNMLSVAIHDDFVWNAITTSIVGKVRRGGNRFVKINCPMCVSRGESPDRRYRCGITRDGQGIGVNCFNCGFKSRFQVGQYMSRDMEGFLLAVGIGSIEVKRLKHKAAQYRKLISSNDAAAAMIPQVFRPSFEERSLPPQSKTITEWANEGCAEDDFINAVNYLYGRGEVIANAMEYYWTPDTEGSMNKRIIMPFYYGEKIVGYTGRLCVPAQKDTPKYMSSIPENFLVNSSVMQNSRGFLIIAEGVFDAVALDCVATAGAKMTEEQAYWLNSCQKTKILLVDRDSSGQRQIDHALAQGWHVAFPKLRDGHGFRNWWSSDVKDAAEAVKKYGRLYTLRSILESRTNNKVEITIKRKLLY